MYLYMTDEQFNKLWNHIDECFHELRDEVGHTRERVDGIYNHLDDIRGLLDTDELERGAQSVQLDRHEDAPMGLDLRVGTLER